MSTRRRLVHVTTTDISLALLLQPQLEAFADAGYEVLGISAPGPFVEGLEASGIRHVPLPNATRSMAPHRDLLALASLRRLFRELRPDVVHTHNPKTGVYGRLAARAAGVPAIVNTVHGLYAQPGDAFTKRAGIYALEAAAARCSHAELVQNEEDIPVLRRIGVPERKLTLLGNGIDLTRFHPGAVTAERAAAVRAEVGATASDVVCGTVGRLVWEKGYRELFAAAAQLRERGTSVIIAVAGPDEPDKRGAVTDDDRRDAERAGVRFLGHRADVEAFYSAIDMFVLPSHREGFPRAAMEAAAMGRAIVATDVRGCRQVVDHGATGLLVPLRDVDALTRAITLLVDDPALRERLGAAGAAKAGRDFDQQRVIDATLATYDRLLAGAS